VRPFWRLRRRAKFWSNVIAPSAPTTGASQNIQSAAQQPPVQPAVPSGGTTQQTQQPEAPHETNDANAEAIRTVRTEGEGRSPGESQALVTGRNVARGTLVPGSAEGLNGPIRPAAAASMPHFALQRRGCPAYSVLLRRKKMSMMPLMSDEERCRLCGCQLNRGAYGRPTIDGRSGASEHHFVAERFFGRSRNRKGVKTAGIFTPFHPLGETSVNPTFSATSATSYSCTTPCSFVKILIVLPNWFRCAILRKQSNVRITRSSRDALPYSTR
jgi:hypothetical protein